MVVAVKCAVLPPGCDLECSSPSRRPMVRESRLRPDASQSAGLLNGDTLIRASNQNRVGLVQSFFAPFAAFLGALCDPSS